MGYIKIITFYFLVLLHAHSVSDGRSATFCSQPLTQADKTATGGISLVTMENKKDPPAYDFCPQLVTVILLNSKGQ